MAKDISKMIINIESEEHFQELVELSDTKVVIIDCFSEWCGPCDAMKPTLLKLWNDISNPAERLTIATCSMDKFKDCIQGMLPENGPAVDKNGCLPLFLILRFKALTSHISGVDAPTIISTLHTNLPEFEKQ